MRVFSEHVQSADVRVKAKVLKVKMNRPWFRPDLFMNREFIMVNKLSHIIKFNIQLKRTGIKKKNILSANISQIHSHVTDAIYKLDTFWEENAIKCMKLNNINFWSL